jgi:hypothetical protein
MEAGANFELIRSRFAHGVAELFRSQTRHRLDSQSY